VNLTINSSVIAPPITASVCDTYTTPWGTVYTQSGTYSETLATTNGCDSIVSVNLTVYPDPTVQVNATGSTIIGLGDSLQLNVSGALNYQWSPSTGLSCSNCSSPVATPSGSLTYIVTGTDSNGCSSTASINITVDIRCDELFIPDIFSPDGIGPIVNEQVCVFSNCIRSMNLAIYDRWGQVLFSTEDPFQCWNGMKDGEDVPAGVYVYRLLVRQIDGKEISKSGNITLIR
jgi:gliding motility-associated-like protein